MKTPKKLRRSVGTSSASSWIRTPLARPRRSSALPKFLAQMGAAAGRRGTAEKHRSWRGVARTSRCSLDIFSPVFQPPEGRRENSPGRLRYAAARPNLAAGSPASCGRDVGFAESGLQAWEGLRKENRPERAADFRALFPKNAFVESDSIQTPFEGDFVVRLIPRAEALGCSVFALRAMPNVETPLGVVCNARSLGGPSSSPAEIAAIIEESLYTDEARRRR